MYDTFTLLGEDINFWAELRRRLDEGSADNAHLLRDIVRLSAKVQYYETMIDRATDFRRAANGDQVGR